MAVKWCCLCVSYKAEYGVVCVIKVSRVCDKSVENMINMDVYVLS